MEFKLNKVSVSRAEKPFRKSKLFIFLKGETLLDDLMRRHDRPYKLYKEEIIPLVKENLKQQGIDIEGMKISWSQYAGCPCGCSPGFTIQELEGYDIFVDVEVVV